MKNFFKFDDKRIVSILWLFISLSILILSICAIKVIEVFVATLFVLFITVLATIFTFNEGIHFNFKKEKIIIIKGMMIKSINMKDVKYFSLEEINKTKKGNLTQKLVDTYDQVNMPSKYVYNIGKVFNIVFYMKNIGNIKVYYGWLYRTRSIERINNQIEKFNKIKENFMKYKNNKLK